MESITRRDFGKVAAAVLMLGKDAFSQDYQDSEKGAYVALASKESADKLSAAVSELRGKYRGRFELVTYEKDPSEAVEKLKAIQPREIAYVCQLSEARPENVRKASSVARSISQGNYGDAIFGVITGIDSTDAAALASCRKLEVKKALLKGDSTFMDFFQEGYCYSEAAKGEYGAKRRYGKLDWRKDGPADTTKILVNHLSNENIDFFLTSGHANHNIWEAGYNIKDGAFFSQQGKLFAVDGDKLEALKAKKDARNVGNGWELKSPKEKIWLPAGNCLIGQVNGDSSMVPNAIRHMGVRQMWASTQAVEYGHNDLGWGIWPYWRQGKMTFGEAAFAVQQNLVYSAEVEGRNVGQSADTFILYGDPGMDAKLLPDRKPEYELSVGRDAKGNDITMTIDFTSNDTLRGYHLMRPVVIFPKAFDKVEVTEKSGVDKVFTDKMFAILDFYKGKDSQLEAGKKAKVVIKAKIK